MCIREPPSLAVVGHVRDWLVRILARSDGKTDASTANEMNKSMLIEKLCRHSVQLLQLVFQVQIIAANFAIYRAR